MIATQLDRERVAKLLGMLGSAYGGEIAAAGRAADRMCREADMTGRDIVVPALPRPDSGGAIADQLEFDHGHPDALNEWEPRFTLSLAQRHRPPAEKQRAILHELCGKCRCAAAREAA